jgi:hypothetical protein
MGFELPQNKVSFTFEGTPWDGAHVACSLAVSMELFWTILEAAQGSISPDGAVQFDKVREANRLIGEYVLVEWDLEHDGKPIPATGEGFDQMPPKFAGLITQKWLEVMQADDDPLPDESSNGTTLGVLSTEMASLTEMNPSRPSNTAS